MRTLNDQTCCRFFFPSTSNLVSDPEQERICKYRPLLPCRCLLRCICLGLWASCPLQWTQGFCESDLWPWLGNGLFYFPHFFCRPPSGRVSAGVTFEPGLKPAHRTGAEPSRTRPVIANTSWAKVVNSDRLPRKSLFWLCCLICYWVLEGISSYAM